MRQHPTHPPFPRQVGHCSMDADNNAVILHPVYFLPDGDITIKVEDSLFRIHRYFLIRESRHFRSLFLPAIPGSDPPGSSETNPVVLSDVTSEDFADFLWIFYNPEHSYNAVTLDEWNRILALAQRWGFDQVERLCIRNIENLTIA